MYAELPICLWSVRGLQGVVSARLRNGLRLRIDPMEYLGRTVLLTGEWDPKVTWVCKKLLRAGDTFVDIGAHCGIVAVEAARLVGPKGSVHAFEPQSRLAAMLRQSVDINDTPWLKVHELALSDRDGKAEIHLPGGKQILASLLASGGEEPSMTIETRETESYLRALGLRSVRLMKIDVEGYEHIVFSSMASLLKEKVFEFILFESVPTEGPFWNRPSIIKLREFGYQFFALPKRLLRPAALPVDANFSADTSAHDFVATRDIQSAQALFS